MFCAFAGSSCRAILGSTCQRSCRNFARPTSVELLSKLVQHARTFWARPIDPSPSKTPLVAVSASLCTQQRRTILFRDSKCQFRSRATVPWCDHATSEFRSTVGSRTGLVRPCRRLLVVSFMLMRLGDRDKLRDAS